MIDHIDTGCVVAAIFIALILLVLATWRTAQNRDSYLGGLLAGIGLAAMAWLVGRTNQDRINEAKYKSGVVSRFIGGLKNLFIRK